MTATKKIPSLDKIYFIQAFFAWVRPLWFYSLSRLCFLYFIIFLLIEMALLWKHVIQSLSPNEYTSILLLDFHLLHAVLAQFTFFL